MTAIHPGWTRDPGLEPAGNFVVRYTGEVSGQLRLRARLDVYDSDLIAGRLEVGVLPPGPRPAGVALYHISATHLTRDARDAALRGGPASLLRTHLLLIQASLRTQVGWRRAELDFAVPAWS